MTLKRTKSTTSSQIRKLMCHFWCMHLYVSWAKIDGKAPCVKPYLGVYCDKNQWCVLVHMGTLRCKKHVWGLLSQQAFLAVCLPALAGLWLHSILMGLWVRERWNREGCGEALVVYGWLWCGHGVAMVRPWGGLGWLFFGLCSLLRNMCAVAVRG